MAVAAHAGIQLDALVKTYPTDTGVVRALDGIDLSVRELVSMMASLYPSPLDIPEVLEPTGLTAIAGQRTQTLSGGQTQRAASPSRSSATQTCSFSTSRR